MKPVRIRYWHTAAGMLILGVGVLGLCVAEACGFDDSLREYLSTQFWFPFARHSGYFARADVQRASAPFAGMVKAADDNPLGRLRTAYQKIAHGDFPSPDANDISTLQHLVAAARSSPSLTRKGQEEIKLINAKIDLRTESDDDKPLVAAKAKLQEFLRTAKTPEYLSEARGWLAHVYYRLNDQTAAGKIYLDELNRKGSNLSRETLVNSLRLTYGYNGGRELLENLDKYFDTPEHAAFAIHLATNPRWDRENAPFRYESQFEPVVTEPPPYARITKLLTSHKRLFASERGARILSLLGMRTALRAAEPDAALTIAKTIPAAASIRRDPDFQWMLGSAYFLSHNYAGAEQPLLELFQSRRAPEDQKCAAAYGLCGVYQKTGNVVEQIRMALWLRSHIKQRQLYLPAPSRIEDHSVYWASSGWDFALLVEAEASVEAIRAFVDKYPAFPDVRLVKYALAVRLARDEKYAESAEIYEAIHAGRRAARMRQLASLYERVEAEQPSSEQQLRATFELAKLLARNPNRVYFNDSLWFGYQRYAMLATKESRVTRKERDTLIANERKLKDAQEERWRAYLLLREVTRDSTDVGLRRRAAQIAIRCLHGINTDRFGRETEIAKADVQLSALLRNPSSARLRP